MTPKHDEYAEETMHCPDCDAINAMPHLESTGHCINCGVKINV